MSVPVSTTAKRDAILAANRVIPVLTIADIADAVPLARALVAGGVTALEVTLRTTAAPESIRRIAGEVEGAIVGVGTIRNGADVDRAEKLGARFMVSPGTTAALYSAARNSPLPFLPGVATASEVMAALDAGFDIVKFFPAVQAGGIPALHALRGPFPQLRVCPTGGIGAANFREWLAVPGVVAVGGSWLAPETMIAARDWAGITRIAAAASAAG